MNPDDLSLWEYCKDCGACCEHCLCVLPREREKIVAATGLDPFEERGGLFFIDFNGKPCLFKEKDGKCSIQSIKPLECLTWPLTESIENGQRVLVIDIECPAKDKLSREFIEEAKKLLAALSFEECAAYDRLNRSAGFKFKKFEE
jgi:Fe-S-cluster containining protein